MISDKEKIEYNAKVKARYHVVARKNVSEKLGPMLPAAYVYYDEEMYCRWDGCDSKTNRAFVVNLDFLADALSPEDKGCSMHVPYCDKHMSQYQAETMIRLAVRHK